MDRDKFRSTNKIWNELRLNDPWSVGYVSDLVERKPFRTKEEWENFYYNSGLERNNLLLKLAPKTRNLLNDFLLIKNNPDQVKAISKSLIALNTFFGRTRDDLILKAHVLCEKSHRKLSLDECFSCVRFRIICETWNGIIVREKNTIKNLQKRFPKFIFRKVEGQRDYEYAIDYELFYAEKLLGAIQIKPKSYLSNTPYINKAKRANERKHQRYTKKYARNVRFVIADTRGNILNEDNFLQRLQIFYEQHVEKK